MPVVIPEGFVQAAWEMRLAGDAQAMFITMGLEVPGLTDYQGLAFALGEAADPGLADCLGNEFTITGCSVRDETNNASAVVSIAGTGSQEQLPQNCAYLIHKETGFGGRANQGRMYIPSPPEGQVNGNGVINQAHVDSINGHLEEFWTSINAVPGVESIVVLHSDASMAPTEVLLFACDAVIATQRRRLR